MIRYPKVVLDIFPDASKLLLYLSRVLVGSAVFLICRIWDAFGWLRSKFPCSDYLRRSLNGVPEMLGLISQGRHWETLICTVLKAFCLIDYKIRFFDNTENMEASSSGWGFLCWVRLIVRCADMIWIRLIIRSASCESILCWKFFTAWLIVFILLDQAFK